MGLHERVLLTTSRNPTHRIRTFSNDLALVLPSLVRVNRGKMSMDEIAEKASDYNMDRVVIVDRGQEGLGNIKFFRIGESGLISVPPVVHVAEMRLRREFGVSRTKPTLAIVSEPSEKLLVMAETLSKFFSIPLMSNDEAFRSNSTVMRLTADTADRIVIAFMVEPNHIEVGPRIVVSSVE